MGKPGIVRYGVAGWAYDDWNGIVYPKPRPKGFKPLDYLMQYFETIEINSSFYAIPAPNVTARWAESATKKPGFEFTMKLWQGFTHVREEIDATNVRNFAAAARPLQDQGVLGTILVQFPQSFKPEAAEAAFLERVLDRFAQFPLTVEIRHRGWLEDRDGQNILDILEPRGVAYCNIDQPRFRECVGLTNVVTAPHAYLRAHGRNFQAWFAQMDDRNARYDYLYPPGEVAELADAVRDLKARAKKVYVITNNHWRGQAAANALQIKAAVEEAIAYAPPQLVKSFEDLGPNVVPETAATGQMEMF